MTVRREKGERRWVAALALIAPLLVAGCATPHTHFTWTFADDAPTRPRPAVVHHVSVQRPQCNCDNVPVPTARPAQQATTHHSLEAMNADNGHATFAWPVRGRILSEFGSGYGGQRNDGINIAASEGQPIRAAADGIVTYTGDGLKNYGNLALVKHDNGYATVYAHAERFVVGKGDHVARGQVIGYAGETGDVSTPQLHFEIRRGARDPVDPRSLLGPLQVASR